MNSEKKNIAASAKPFPAPFSISLPMMKNRETRENALPNAESGVNKAMSTEKEYIEFVCEQIQDTGIIRYKKMFGEYMVYVNDKPVLLVCDDTVYVKKLDCLTALMQQADCGIPYKGAKEHYILDIDRADFCRQIVSLLEQVTPLPKPRKKK